jgi:hypothetical protein
MTARRRAADEPRPGPDTRHSAAIARNLGWADDAAARDDYTDALLWLGTIEAIGDQLTPEYHTKRQTWLELADANPRARRNSKAA